MVIAKGADVVVVGGGVAGCTVAYMLAKSGMGVTLVERDSIGAHASGFAAGVLIPLYGSGIPGPLQPLALRGNEMHRQLWQELKEETGIDVLDAATPLLRIAFGEDEEKELRALADTVEGVKGFSATLLSAREVSAIDSRLSERITAGLLIEGTRSIDSYLYTLAMSRAAEKKGVSIVHDTVTGLEANGPRVTAVGLSGGSLPCDRVVVATGPWAGEVGEWLGTPVPVYPVKGEILRLAAPGPGPEHNIGRTGFYVNWKRDGLVWCGTTDEEAGFDDRPSVSAREGIMEGVGQIMPCLEQSRVVRHTACLRPTVEDGLPIIGGVPGWDGVYLATGAGHKGILLSPAMGQAIADLVLAGETELPIAEFGLDRFQQGSGA